MEAIGAARAEHGWVLRTGGSPGADQAFYRGARSAGGAVELYLPWPGFQAGSWREEPGVAVVSEPAPAAYALAARHHPRWEELSELERHLRARDVHQVLGPDLATPARLVICWTPDGSHDGAGPRAGGTGQALRVAHAHGVPVLNLARREDLDRALEDPAR